MHDRCRGAVVVKIVRNNNEYETCTWERKTKIQSVEVAEQFGKSKLPVHFYT
jgi:phosphoribosylformimino-5-aminoimidazole carboxamide ribonucleotide (ProFAR) isomerase